MTSNPLLAWVAHALAPLLLPAALLGSAYLLPAYLSLLPDTLSGLIEYGPLALMALAAVLGGAFGRGKVMLTALLLLAGQSLIRWSSDQVLPAQVTRDITTLALYGLVPLNLALISCYRERGVTSGHGNLRVAILVCQGVAVSILLKFPLPELARLLEQAQLPFPDTIAGLLPSPVARLSASALLLASLVITARAYWEYSAIGFALLGALAGYLLAMLHPDDPDSFALFMSASALLLSIAVLRESYRMAFRDELTGLPQRRALREQMMTLIGRYTVAMIDIDHFKKVNDRHGHDVGDQVLQMVAAQIDRIGGGGRAYRQGGEEFAVVFPRRSLDSAIEFLDEIRERVAEYHMVIRDSARPEDTERGTAAGGRKSGSYRDASPQLSVTISIGAAERSERGEAPDDVLKKADAALYRAKRAGRNRIAT